MDSGADLLIYGMGEKPVEELCRMLKRGVPFRNLTNIPQTCVLRPKGEAYATNKKWATITLASHEECLADKRKYAVNFRHIEEESNSLHAAKLLQEVGDRVLVVNPPYPPLDTKELDRVYALPFTRMPHPRYKGKEIPAYNMIRHSVTTHRGCFGGCAFCTISAHQGKFIASRSPESILREVESVCRMPDFRGTISDLGGPSANMYGMRGRDSALCERCKRPSCLHPAVCKNLDTDHSHLTALYERARHTPGVKHCFIGSGIRYDLAMHRTGDKQTDSANRAYLETVVRHHVSGRLKVAPEHTSDTVLHLMRKPSFSLFKELNARFQAINRQAGLRQQLIPYFISSHPGCTLADMAELAIATKELDFRLEQVQDFTPTPMTLATEMYYSGLHPYTLRSVSCARTEREKKEQNIFFFWYKPEFRQEITRLLTRLKRPDLLKRLYTPGPNKGRRKKE